MLTIEEKNKLKAFDFIKEKLRIKIGRNATGTKYLNICLHEYGDLTLFITMDDLEKLEHFRNYSLESLGL